jgi:hypothetical protein
VGDCPGAVESGRPGLGRLVQRTIHPVLTRPHDGAPIRSSRVSFGGVFVTPLGVGQAVGDIVAEAVRVARDSGLSNRTHAMFNEVEGDTGPT